MTSLCQGIPKLGQEFARHSGGHDAAHIDAALLHLTADVGELFPTNDADVSVGCLDIRPGQEGISDDDWLGQRGVLSFFAHEAHP